jgi:hypothetical protein
MKKSEKVYLSLICYVKFVKWCLILVEFNWNMAKVNVA